MGPTQYQNGPKRDAKRKNCINGDKIYKIAGVMHAVVFADGAPEAKNAQVVGYMQNSEGLKMRKNGIQNGQGSGKSRYNANKSVC